MEKDELVKENVTLADLRDLRERMAKYRDNIYAVCVTLDTFFYSYDQHIGERIIIWDSRVENHFYFDSLREAREFVEKLEKEKEE